MYNPGKVLAATVRTSAQHLWNTTTDRMTHADLPGWGVVWDGRQGSV